jgi:hypothetical protein
MQCFEPSLIQKHCITQKIACSFHILGNTLAQHTIKISLKNKPSDGSKHLRSLKVNIKKSSYKTIGYWFK